MSSEESEKDNKAKVKIKKEPKRAYQSGSDSSFCKEDSSTSSQRKQNLLNKKRKPPHSSIKIKKEKKKRKRRAEFLDMEAEESSSDNEESNDGEGEITKEEQARLLKQIDSNIYKKKAFEDIDEDELIERYKNAEDNEEGIDITEGIGLNILQAKVDDPKLWMVKCKIGKEQESVSNIYHKYFYLNKGSCQYCLKILSAICFDSLKGFIYVEAFKECNVREAITGMSTLFSSSIKLVPLNEMEKVFQFDKLDNVKVKVNQWVKMKSGINEGDIAQVIAIQDPLNKIYVKLVPRMKSDSSVSRDFKPQRKLFNPKNLTGVATKTSNLFGAYLYYNKHMYKDGFLIKGVKSTALVFDDVIPSIDDLKLFQSFDKNGNGNDEAYDKENEERVFDIDMSMKQSKKSRYHPGDRVHITQNDFKGIAGKVISQNDNTVQIKLNVEGLAEELFEFPIDSVVKDFLPGDLVHCIRGVNIGKQGCLVKIEPETSTVIIYSEAFNTHFKSNSADIVLSNTFESLEHNQLKSSIKIGDLVQEHNANSGVFYVLNVLDYSLKTINHRNEIHTISCRDVFSVKPFKSGLDGKSNPLMPGDIIKVIEGEYKGKEGIIRGIYNHLLFLYNEGFTNSNGIFSINTKKVEILGSELIISNAQQGRVNLKRIPVEIKELIGKIVKVSKGIWKGYTGRVSAVTEKTVNVELLSKEKNITIDVENVIDIENSQSLFGANTANSGGWNLNEERGGIGGGWNTPAYYPQTPKPSGTNANPLRTPSYFDEVKW